MMFTMRKYLRTKYLLASVMAALGPATFASAQEAPIDTCRNETACDTISGKLVESARRVLAEGRHREAARLIYPAVLSRKTSPLVKARAAEALSDILMDAELYGYAANQKANAIAQTRAPSSESLLAHARLVAKTGDEKATLAAYDRVEDLARSAANLEVYDKIIADYRALGLPRTAANMRAERPALEARAEAACDAAKCDRRTTVDARAQEIGSVRYPSEARRGAVGECRVTLNITEDARPVDLVPDCTDPVFMETAMLAVQTTTFSARYENGQPRPRYNMIIPFLFEPG